MKTQQLDLFNQVKKPAKKSAADIESTAWCVALVATAMTMPRAFWFSELRIKHGREPKVPAWWGMSSFALKKAGLIPTNTTRNAPRGYGFRNGGTDRLWEKPK